MRMYFIGVPCTVLARWRSEVTGDELKEWIKWISCTGEGDRNRHVPWREAPRPVAPQGGADLPLFPLACVMGFAID